MLLEPAYVGRCAPRRERENDVTSNRHLDIMMLMSATPPGLSASPAGETLIALEAGDRESATESAASIRTRLAARFAGCTATVLVPTAGPETALVDPAAAPPAAAGPVLAEGAIAGHLRAVLQEADRRGARAAALLSAGAHDESVDWLGLLLQPILGAAFDFVCPAYRRGRLGG